MSNGHLRELCRLPRPRELARIVRVWRGVWLIVGAAGDDDLVAEVARLGRALRDAQRRGDRQAALDVLREMHHWLNQLAGVLVARVTAPFRRLL